jgi:hypothetical protein
LPTRYLIVANRDSLSKARLYFIMFTAAQTVAR